MCVFVFFPGRGHAALPAGEPGASGGDDPHRGPAGAAGHGQKDATLLPDVPAGAAGGRREEHRARRHTKKNICFLAASVISALCRLTDRFCFSNSQGREENNECGEQAGGHGQSAGDASQEQTGKKLQLAEQVG